jgi:hypothetical protein
VIGHADKRRDKINIVGFIIALAVLLFKYGGG